MANATDAAGSMVDLEPRARSLAVPSRAPLLEATHPDRIPKHLVR